MAERTHLIGLLLGTEDDWPVAFETLISRLGPITDASGHRHRIATERITMEPFDLRDRPRYELVIDRLAYWYYLPREWLKKVALMNDVYLLNSPFTFQSMEKHAAYCAMIRLGLKVPPTVLVPHKDPPDNSRFQYTAARYNQPFDLPAIAEKIGYPLFMKPYDGGQWIGVSRVRNQAELERAYDESGRRLMHLQASVENFDVFARSLSIGPETMVMKFRPEMPMHDRYAVAHDFLSPELGDEVLTISRLINAFFRWEFNSCECLVRGDQVHPIDYANASPGRRADEPALLLPVGDQDAGQVVHVLPGHRPPAAARPRHPHLLRDRRPRGPRLRGEARGLSAPRRRVLRDRPLSRLLRQPPRPRRRARARLGGLARLRPATAGHGPGDLPRARAGAVRRARARPRRAVGARERPRARLGLSAFADVQPSSTSPTSGPSSLRERRDRPGSASSLWVGGAPARRRSSCSNAIGRQRSSTMVRGSS